MSYCGGKQCVDSSSKEWHLVAAKMHVKRVTNYVVRF